MLTRLGERVAARPRRSLLVLLAVFLVALVFGAPTVGLLNSDGGFQPPNSGSERATERIEAATGAQEGPGVVALVQTPNGADTPAAERRVTELERAIADRPGIDSVVSTVSTGQESFVSPDGRSTFIAATLAANADEELVATDMVERFGNERDVALGGEVIADYDIDEGVSSGLATAELLAFPFLLLLSLIFFRGRATLLPLVVGVMTVLGSFLVMRLINQGYELGIFALNLVVGLGLGLAIDYSLFLLTRYREELKRSGPGMQAIRATMASAGRTVVFSAATVAVALSTLIIFPLGFLKSMGIAGATVAVVAAVAALTVAPAFMGLWGAKLAVQAAPRAARLRERRLVPRLPRRHSTSRDRRGGRRRRDARDRLAVAGHGLHAGRRQRHPVGHQLTDRQRRAGHLPRPEHRLDDRRARRPGLRHRRRPGVRRRPRAAPRRRGGHPSRLARREHLADRPPRRR